jgi:epoxide hydrolase 4
VDQYKLEVLVDDVLAVIAHYGADRAIVVGHDWGGTIAQIIAGVRPDIVERLVLMNIPHLGRFNKFAAASEDQRERSKYVLEYFKPDAAEAMDIDYLVRNIRDEAERAEIAEVMRRSSMEALLQYYRANYPQPDAEDAGEFPEVRIQVPTLIFWGLDDPYISPGALNDNATLFDAELTVVTLPGAGHWVHRDAADLVTRRLAAWLSDSEPWGPQA